MISTSRNRSGSIPTHHLTIVVSSAPAGGGLAVAVVATLSKGYDLDYVWKQVDRAPAKDSAGYYIQASESGGEPPGRWWSLLRADGRSVYQRHGGVRYATCAQLTLEERMVAQAGASGAPRMDRAQAAHALGAGPAELEETVTGRAEGADAPHTESGLRADQAAAAWSVLTDGRLVSVINAPGGIREDTRAGRGRADLGRGRAGPSNRHHPLPVRP
jgi:hypothetical protein